MAKNGHGSDYTAVMSEEDQAVSEAIHAALNELAAHLGGSTDTGGPVENATQIKGRGDLGVLLTDRDDRVLGRVWLAFGASVQAASTSTSPGDGSVAVQAEVCSEVIEPPVALDAWCKDR